MEKNVEFLSFETVSILLATFPNSDGEFKREVVSTIDNLLNSLKNQPKANEIIYDISNIYENIVKKLISIKEEEEYLFFNFKRVVNIQGKVFSKILESKKHESEILTSLNNAKNILEKDRRVLLTYLLEEPKRMKDILKMMDINKMLSDVNKILEDIVKNKKEVILWKSYL